MTAPATVAGLRPQAWSLLAALRERVRQTTDPVLLELVRLRIAQLIANDAYREEWSAGAAPSAKIRALPDYPVSPLFSPAERDTLGFTEQFVMDVGGTTEARRADLARHFGGDGTRELVTAIFVVEFAQRLQMIAARLLPEDGPAPPLNGSPAVDATPRELLGAYQEAVMHSNALDPVTTELVRLRCARTHRCRICQTLRLADARAAGVDESVTGKIDFYEHSDLPDRAKAALRVTDAFITLPDLLTDTVAQHARAWFSPEELASLCLTITKWSTQKIRVALGTDGADGVETDADGLAVLRFDSGGRATGYRRG